MDYDFHAILLFFCYSWEWQYSFCHFLHCNIRILLMMVFNMSCLRINLLIYWSIFLFSLIRYELLLIHHYFLQAFNTLTICLIVHIINTILSKNTLYFIVSGIFLNCSKLLILLKSSSWGHNICQFIFDVAWVIFIFFGLFIRFWVFVNYCLWRLNILLQLILNYLLINWINRSN